MSRNHNPNPLSRFGVLVAQLESIVASATHKPPDPLLCFDLLSDLISAIHDEPKDSIILSQRKCEDALYSLLVLGARRPVRHLASVAMAKVILKGDSISIYSRASSLQGFLADGKRSGPQKVAGAAQCMGELYRFFGRRIISGLLETTSIVAKLLKFTEDFVRQEALRMLRNALEGSGGHASSAAYSEAFRIITRMGVGDKSLSVRIGAARCLKAFANIGGPGLGTGELEHCLSYCVKALDDPVKSVRDAFAESLGALLALGMNPDAQVQPRGKSHVTPKKLEGCLQKHLTIPFAKASGPRLKEVRFGLSLSWVYFLQALCLKYLHPDSELQNYAVQVMDMLPADTSIDAQALACVLYILRVGITDQMTEPTQRGFSVFLGKQLLSSDSSPSMRVAVLRTLSYVLKTLGEVPLEFKEVFDDTVVAAVSHYSPLVRVEAALTLRALAEVDPSCVGGLISYAVTMLNAARDYISYDKGGNFKEELGSLHGQAAVLASLVSISQKLPLGYPGRLPMSVLEVCKNLLTKSSRNPVAACVEREAGWTLLSSLLASVTKEELEDQVFDILALWASTFNGNSKHSVIQTQDLGSEICVLSAAIDALTSFVKCFVSSDAFNRRILVQPVLLYLNRALSYISQLAGREQADIKPSLDVLVIRVLLNYEALSDPPLYKSDHPQIVHICTTPFREASGCEESSCLRTLLDKRDAWLGPWIPGRDWFEDELRSFQGGKSGVLTCVWENEPPSFPQPETISKMLVNQMLLCFGTMFAAQDSIGMLSFLGIIDQCLKSGKKQTWRASSITNICVGLLAGLKILLTQRPEPLGMEILSAAQAIFQSILAEGDICASQRRASSEGLGLLARLGNDTFTARLTKQFLGDATSTVDFNYAGSIALSLGCIHRSAGGMALSSLVPTTVNVISSLAKSSNASLQIWSLHGLLLTIESSGLSYVSQVQATLGLAMDILLSEESGLVDLQQAMGRLINAIVAVIGPELSPGSIFFSRCKSAVAEISSCQETATLLESVRFTQQLVLFAPQAVTVHFHVLSLLPTLSSRQPTLRHLALSTLRHLIEKDPASVIEEQIEETLFLMLDEETDTEIGKLARTTIMRLLYASGPSRPSHWLLICRNMVLSTSSRLAVSRDNDSVNDSSSGLDGEKRLDLGDDDENMVSSANSSSVQSSSLDYSNPNFKREKHLRYRTRVFAAECLSHLPQAVGENPAHYDLSLARAHVAKKPVSKDWLVLQLQELVSLAYQISTIQFEKMRPIGVSLLCTIIDKFAATPDPELPDHLLLEQYQAQLVSAVRSALDSFSGPMLLEAGLQLATKMLMSGIISRDQAAVKRIFSLISRPLDDFNDLYYPSYAEWVSCKIKVRLLTVHASLKCYMFAFLRRQGDEIPDEYLALLPLFQKSSSMLGIYWLSLLKDYSFVRFHLHPENWKPFLDGIQSPVVSAELQPCLEEAWPMILQALVLDAVPESSNLNGSLQPDSSTHMPTSGYSMVELRLEDFQFLWGFLLLVLFQEQDVSLSECVIPVSCIKSKINNASPVHDSNLYDVFFPVLQFMSTEKFFAAGYLSLDACRELLQVFSYLLSREDSWDRLIISTLSQILQNCPKDFLAVENFAYLASELCSTSLFKLLLSCNLDSQCLSNWEKIISVPFMAASTLLERLEPQMQLEVLLPFLLIGYKCIGGASTEICLSKTNDFVQTIVSSLKKLGKSQLGDDGATQLASITRACLHAASSLTRDCVKAIHHLENKTSSMRKLLLLKLAFAIEQIFSYATLAYVFEGPGERQETSPVFLKLLQFSIQQIQSLLTDTDIQIRAVGLQVVKVTLQKGTTSEYISFLSFFVGELVGDFFIIIQKILERPINKEAVAVGGECLKILMLLQTLSKDIDYQKGLMKLMFEAILMIFSVSDDSSSQESNVLRNISLSIVSQLALSASSAALIRDLLLEMPATQRQRLQDMIRSSVVHDQNPKPISSSSGPPLVIKLPPHAPQQQNIVINPLPLPVPVKVNESYAVEDEGDDDEEEDDDWDTFQSFPASGSESAPAPENSLSVSNIDNDGNSSSPSFGMKENSTAESEELNQDLNVSKVECSLEKEESWVQAGDDNSTSLSFNMMECASVEDEEIDEESASKKEGNHQTEEESGSFNSSTSCNMKENVSVEIEEHNEEGTRASKVAGSTQTEESPSFSTNKNVNTVELDDGTSALSVAGSSQAEESNGHADDHTSDHHSDENVNVETVELDDGTRALSVARSSQAEESNGHADDHTSDRHSDDNVKVEPAELDDGTSALSVARSSQAEESNCHADDHPSDRHSDDNVNVDTVELDDGTSALSVAGGSQAEESNGHADDDTRDSHSDDSHIKTDEKTGLSSPLPEGGGLST